MDSDLNRNAPFELGECDCEIYERERERKRKSESPSLKNPLYLPWTWIKKTPFSRKNKYMYSSPYIPSPQIEHPFELTNQLNSSDKMQEVGLMSIVNVLCKEHGTSIPTCSIPLVFGRKNVFVLNWGVVNHRFCFYDHKPTTSKKKSEGLPYLPWSSTVVPVGWKVASIARDNVWVFETRLGESYMEHQCSRVTMTADDKLVLVSSPWLGSTGESFRYIYMTTFPQKGADDINCKLYGSCEYEHPQGMIRERNKDAVPEDEDVKKLFEDWLGNKTLHLEFRPKPSKYPMPSYSSSSAAAPATTTTTTTTTSVAKPLKRGWFSSFPNLMRSRKRSKSSEDEEDDEDEDEEEGDQIWTEVEAESYGMVTAKAQADVQKWRKRLVEDTDGIPLGLDMALSTLNLSSTKDTRLLPLQMYLYIRHTGQSVTMHDVKYVCAVANELAKRPTEIDGIPVGCSRKEFELALDVMIVAIARLCMIYGCSTMWKDPAGAKKMFQTAIDKLSSKIPAGKILSIGALDHLTVRFMLYMKEQEAKVTEKIPTTLPNVSRYYASYCWNILHMHHRWNEEFESMMRA